MKDPQLVEMHCALTLGLVRELIAQTEHMPDEVSVGVRMSGSVPIGIWAGSDAWKHH